MRGSCPFHSEPGSKSRSFSVNPDKNVYHCFRNDCNQSGNVLDFWASYHKLTLHQAALHLAEAFAGQGHKVDLVLFCGDAYKSREPSQTHQREFAKRINRLSINNIPIFLLIGNHDLPNAIGRATATEILGSLRAQWGLAVTASGDLPSIFGLRS